MNKRWHLPFLLFLIIGTIIIVGENKPTFRTQQGKIFGTLYTVTYEHNADLEEEIMGAMKAVDGSLSPFNKQSLITHINNNEPVEADSLFTKVFRTAEQVYAESHGAFDPTVAPLVNAWGFGFKSGIEVSPAVIDSLQALVGTTDEPIPTAEPRHPIADSTTSKFANLQFGPNYDPTHR